jgi:hypothetical protein
MSGQLCDGYANGRKVGVHLDEDAAFLHLDHGHVEDGAKLVLWNGVVVSEQLFNLLPGARFTNSRALFLNLESLFCYLRQLCLM